MLELILTTVILIILGLSIGKLCNLKARGIIILIILILAAYITAVCLTLNVGQLFNGFLFWCQHVWGDIVGAFTKS